MLLYKLLIAFILLHDDQERKCEEKVTDHVDSQSKGCSIEDQRNDASCDLCQSLGHF